MAKGYTINNMENLTEECFREERAKKVAKIYEERIKNDTTTSRTKIIQQISMEVGITDKTVREILYKAGLPTSLPNYENCGGGSRKNQEQQ